MSNDRLRRCVLACASLVLAVPCTRVVHAQCPSWISEFGTPPERGVVTSLATFDDGSGSALFVGGTFTSVAGLTAQHIAKWDGTQWFALAGGVDDTVTALLVFDDGNGPALYVGGRFENAGGAPAARIARWDGAAWSAVGIGMNGGVRTLATFDDGTGTKLYAGGEFTTADGNVARGIARFDGTSWGPFAPTTGGVGGNRGVFALASFDDGAGSALYAGGDFATIDGIAANRIARWRSGQWEALAGGVSATGDVPTVEALTVFDDGLGGGVALWVGGYFNSVNGVGAGGVARWRASGWTSGPHLPSFSLQTRVKSFAVFDDGSGSAARLFAGGAFDTSGASGVDNVARWTNGAWASLDGGADAQVNALAPFDDGSGARLFAGGVFDAIGDVTTERIAAWDGTNWTAAGTSSVGLDGNVTALAHADACGTAGPELFAGGSFTHAGELAVAQVARYAEGSWHPLGDGLAGDVLCLRHFAGPAGVELFAGGRFSLPHTGIARWNGTIWLSVGGGVSSSTFQEVSALEVFDDGSGPALFVGGYFSKAGNVNVDRIAKWNGASWSALGAGVTGESGVAFVRVLALRAFDDGQSQSLYVGGHFPAAGGASANHIARWDGAQWHSLAGGIASAGIPEVAALAVFDDGGGPALYAGGTFELAGGVLAANVARWDGAQWSALGSGIDGAVRALIVFDDGNGAALYALGSFATAGGVPAANIARFDGVAWSDVDGGTSASAFAATVVLDPDTGSESLYAGGEFTSAGGKPARHVALRAGCASAPATPFCFGDGSLPTACPCSAPSTVPNPSAAIGHGCANSFQLAGARLSASGRTASDDVVLTATGLAPSGFAFFVVASDEIASGSVAGDGVQCLGGSKLRFGGQLAACGAVRYPSVELGHAQSLATVSGALPMSGETRRYQVVYRNAASSFCSPATFNLTNGCRITW